MITAFDIETIPNTEALKLMPEPEVKTGNLKDPAKIAEKIAEAKREQVEKAALDPLTARVACAAFVSEKGSSVSVMSSLTDVGETLIIQAIMNELAKDGIRIATWNGAGFDLPMVYKRAMILGIDPRNFGAPPLTTWTKRYNTDRHFDLMQIWCAYNGFAKLDTVSKMVIGEKKIECDVTLISDMIQTEDGRLAVAEYCQKDTELTFRLFNRFNGTLFA